VHDLVVLGKVDERAAAVCALPEGDEGARTALIGGAQSLTEPSDEFVAVSSRILMRSFGRASTVSGSFGHSPSADAMCH
jgi:hypothetical protein